MPAVALNDIDSLADALSSFRYELLVTTPAGGNTAQVSRDMTIKCQSVAFPGSDIEDMMIGLNGFQFHYRGRKFFSGILAVTFVEFSDGAIWQQLKNWQELIVNTQTGNGVPKQQYARDITINVYDEQGDQPALMAVARNAWPSQVPDVMLDGQSTMHFSIQASFQYDWIEYEGVNLQGRG